MNKDIIAMNMIILFYILQRVSELFINKRNEAWLIDHCEAVEVSPKESLRMKLFHTLWFISLLIESNFKQAFSFTQENLVVLSILMSCLAIRFYTIKKLGYFWTVKVFRMKNQVLSVDGLYRYLRHPNYLVVILELIFIPLLMKAYGTLMLFSVLNIFVLSSRIRLEEETLMKQTDYQIHFGGVKKILPFIFSLLLISARLHAEELNYEFNSYDDAKKASDYVKFQNTSTKIGLITSEFDGYAKKIKLVYKMNGNVVEKLEVGIPTKSLDTDNNARNQKMWDDILNAKDYPVFFVILTEPLTLVEGEKTINMTFKIKDYEVVKPVKIVVSKAGEKYLIKGEAVLGLKEMKLPDPSIAIATVKDNFDLKFAIHFP